MRFTGKQNQEMYEHFTKNVFTGKVAEFFQEKTKGHRQENQDTHRNSKK